MKKKLERAILGLLGGGFIISAGCAGLKISPRISGSEWLTFKKGECYIKDELVKCYEEGVLVTHDELIRITEGQ